MRFHALVLFPSRNIQWNPNNSRPDSIRYIMLCCSYNHPLFDSKRARFIVSFSLRIYEFYTYLKPVLQAKIAAGFLFCLWRFISFY
jgi:hypothetical protein